MTQFDALLWDCDGCLIDSEIIACRIAAEYLTGAGYPVTTEAFIADFAGKTQAQIDAVISERTGGAFNAKINTAEKKQAILEAFNTELKPINGILSALESVRALGLVQVVASGSGLARLEHTLKLTNLWNFFAAENNGQSVFSAEQVPNGKPAPDVFLLAAERVGVAPHKCAVIEDSVAGVKSGKAAGMTVFGFVGSSHGSPELALKLSAAGADAIFDDMDVLEELMRG